ncbi:MAG: hypothetical protein KAT48_05240 [Bacteroidales bacterium]|nr:hypothetical protein [Bacteroidales bacterium]
MKKLFFAITLIFMGTQLIAQSDNDYLELARGVLNVEKKAAITEVMQLTDVESQPFWNLYNEYQGKLYLIQNKRIDIISDFIENFETLNNEKADELWSNSMAYSQEILKLKKSYYKKFKKILPAGKAARFFQAENKIEALINAQIAIEIPLIETK